MGEATPTSAPARLLVLGPIEVHGADGPIALREGIPRRLLAALTIRMNTPVAVDTIIEELWPTRMPSDPRNALQAQVSYVRRQLEPVRSTIAVERYGDGYRLEVRDATAFELDAQRFERALRALDTELSPDDASGCVRGADAALELWRGHPYADARYDDFARGEITRLQELHAAVSERRCRALLALGRDAEATTALQLLVTEHPLRESLWGALMLALYRSQRQAEALRAFGQARERLVEDLGVEPGPALRELEARILAQDPTLHLESPPGASTVLHGAPARITPEPRAADELGTPLEPPFTPQIPEPLSSLIGRADQIEEVAALVRANRLTTLTGVGGVGKTRLAIEVAHRLKTEWPVRVIELGALPPGADVTLLLASELGVTSVPETNPLDAISARLGPRPSLLVFDTCEHVIEPIALAAATLLRRNADVRILATSRQSLGVSGELVWSVPPLDLGDPPITPASPARRADAVQLFEARARAVRSDFVLDDADATTVAQICRALDGLPLAIELAAARTNLLSPSAILDRLSDRFALLSKGARTAETRQRSFRALLDWSYDMLSADERTFFARLSAFSGSFDVAAAEAVAGDGLGTDPLDLLGALVDRSLVSAAGGARFRLLDSLRAFAEARCSDEERPEQLVIARGRHAAWYRRVALEADPKSHGPLPHAWPVLRAESANCLAALAWYHECNNLTEGAQLAGALAGFWMLEGQIVHADRWLKRFRVAPADDATLASLQRGLAILELYQSRFAEATAESERAVELARRSDDGHLVASCLLPYGSALWGVGRFDASIAALREAATRFDAVADARGRGFTLARLGRTLADVDDERAIATLVEANELLERSGDGWMSCVAQEHLAGALLRAGRPAEAIELAERAVSTGEHVGSHAGLLAAMLTLGRALLAAGEIQRAGAIHAAALGRSIASGSGNLGFAADAVDALAHVADRLGHAELAAELLASATAMRDDRHVSIAFVARAGRTALVRRVVDAVGQESFDRFAASGRRDPAWAQVRVAHMLGAEA